MSDSTLCSALYPIGLIKYSHGLALLIALSGSAVLSPSTLVRSQRTPGVVVSRDGLTGSGIRIPFVAPNKMMPFREFHCVRRPAVVIVVSC